MEQPRFAPILAKVPVRVSFFGGGTDMREYSSRFGGLVLATSISHFITVTLTPTPSRPGILIELPEFGIKSYLTGIRQENSLPEEVRLVLGAVRLVRAGGGFSVKIDSSVPSSSGLGTSSAVAVGLLGALYASKGVTKTPSALAGDAVCLERDILKIPGGMQDQYAVAAGGLNLIAFPLVGPVRLTPLSLPPAVTGCLENRLLLVYVGRRKRCGLQSRLSRAIRSDGVALDLLTEAKTLCRRGVGLLESANLDGFGRLLGHAWRLKKRINSAVSDNSLDNLYAEALQCGALGGKLLGAGGGGCLLLYCPPESAPHVASHLETLGGSIIPFRFEREGLRIRNA